MLSVYKIVNNDSSLWSKYGFGVKLYSMYIIGLMTQCHNISLFAFRCYFQTIRKAISAYNPRMVTPCKQLFAQSFE